MIRENFINKGEKLTLKAHPRQVVHLPIFSFHEGSFVHKDFFVTVNSIQSGLGRSHRVFWRLDLQALGLFAIWGPEKGPGRRFV